MRQDYENTEVDKVIYNTVVAVYSVELSIMASFFFVATDGDDAHTGYDHLGFAQTNMTWDPVAKTLSKVGGFATDYTGGAYSHTAGDVIYIDSATASKSGWYTISAATADQLTLDELICGVGIDSEQSDVQCYDGPLLTINHAMSLIEAADKAYVKTGTYQEEATIVTAGIATGPIIFEAYTSVPGDFNGTDLVVMDGKITAFESRDYGIKCSEGMGAYYIIKGFRCQNYAVDGIQINGSCGRLENCESNNNGRFGIYFVSNLGNILSCSVNSNTSYGIWLNSSRASIYGGIFSDNSSYGIYAPLGGTINSCIAKNNTTANIYLSNASYPCVITNCIIDGANSTATGINFGVTVNPVAMNNIIIRHPTYGIDKTSDTKIHSILMNNIFNGNGTDLHNMPTGQGNIYADPKFINAGNHDYRLRSNSPARGSGYPGTIGSLKNNMDIGALQREIKHGELGGSLIK